LTLIQYAAIWVGSLLASAPRYYDGPYSHRRQEFLEILWTGLALSPLVVIGAGILIAGARRMMRLERYEFAFLACVWAIVPWSFFVFPLALVFGIWAIVVLCRREVKMAFVRKAVEARLGVAVAVPATVPRRGKLRSFFGAIGSLVIGSRVKGEALS